MQEKTWKNRRSQRMDKMELLTLQSSLKSEIEAKESMREELRTVKARNVELEKSVSLPSVMRSRICSLTNDVVVWLQTT